MIVKFQSINALIINNKSPNIKQYHYGEKEFVGVFEDNPGCYIAFVFFDIFLLPTINMMTYCCKFRFLFLFIQHGVFSDLTAAKRDKKMSISWYISSIGQALKFLSQHGFSWKNTKLLMNVMKNGAWAEREKLTEFVVPFEMCVFWSQADAATLTSEFAGSINNVVLCDSPDKSLLNLEYSDDVSVLFITQPLVEDKIVREEQYVSYINELIDKYGDKLIIIRHPRFSIIPDVGVYLSNLDNITVETAKVIGYYSSLLLAVPSSIPVEVVIFSEPLIKKAWNEILSIIGESNLECYKSFDDVISSFYCA